MDSYLEYIIETNGFNGFVKEMEHIHKDVFNISLENKGLRFKKNECMSKANAKDPEAVVRRVTRINRLVTNSKLLRHARKYFKIENRCISIDTCVFDSGYESERLGYKFIFCDETEE